MTRVFAALLLLAGCTAETRGPPAPAPEPVEGPPSASAPWIRPVPAESATGLSVPARVVQTAESEAVVVAPLEARVVAVHVKPGDIVAKGDSVADVVMPELESAVAEIRGADGQYTVLQRRHERLASLQRDGLAVKSDVVALEVELARVDATRKRARAVLSGAGLSRAGTHVLRSPIEGIVVDADVRLGEVRRPDDGPLATVRLRSGQRVSALLPRRPEPDARPLFVRDGVPAIELKLVSSIADASGFGYRAWFEPIGKGGLETAARGRVEFRVEATTDAWRIPGGAVATDADGAFVMAAQGEARARVPVEVLRVVGELAIVRGAIREDMRIDTDPERGAESP